MDTSEDSDIFMSRIETPAGEQTGRWPLRDDVFTHAEELAGEEEHASADYGPEPELADYGPEPELADHGLELAEDPFAGRHPVSESIESTWPARSVRVSPGRLVVERHPMLAGHAGKPPDLVLKWNAMNDPSQVDVVVHLHGYSGHGRAMNLVRDKEPASGLDFGDPGNPAAQGRTSPTLFVLPRGHYFGGRSGMGYSFPALTGPGAVQALVNDALMRFGAETSSLVTMGRLILTAHSGGGAALMAILKHTDPDEVFAFDALYSSPEALIVWARRRIAQDSGALRVIYRAGEGTAAHSEQVHRAVRDAGLATFQVERTRVAHNDIPRRFGWRLLTDAAAQLADTGAPGAAARKENEEFFAETGWRFEDPESEHDELAFEELYGADGEDGEYAGHNGDAGYGGAVESYAPEELFVDEESGEVENEEWRLDREASGELWPSEHEAFPSGLVLTPVTGPTGHKEEHWDPYATGLPLYDTGPAVRRRKVSARFTVGELAGSGGQVADKARISVELVRCLQAIRDRLGKSVRISSGYRSWARNVRVYSGRQATMSRHCSGQAADISVVGMTGMEIAKVAIDVWGDKIGIGVGDRYAHIDVRGHWAVWTYFKGAADKQAKAEIEAYRAGRGTAGLGGTSAQSPPKQPTGEASAPHVVAFVRAFQQHARRSQDETGVPWLVTLGQAALESGWGKHAPRNNFFGIKAKASAPESSRQLLRTKEVLKRPNAVFPEVISVTPRPDGKYDYIVKDWFRAYESPAEAFSAHGAFLRNNKRYASAFAHLNDPYAFARAVAAAGYATAPSYASALTGVMRMIEHAAGGS
ncbi:glucosaminidase domain-containing protein [Streptosporangium carneum]|uniref:Mannosyl-glycoprotein endo-beta-N-acetylglucosamidase-like domain-containing protein n=1 Tax=Streptosporangium carneum TaxID=47481 RepID=A0A9W6I7E0_9ACTN|nr:glucosaminidase domain-containing protein [Streptosporangium carneum]GLK12993.1 hypothetical protein GCM10017600_64030 [Streptosporangium carneum]